MWPSGGVPAATPMPMLPPAPPWFSTGNCCFRLIESCCAISRAMVSVAPPAANGTIMRTGLLGYVACDCATGATAAPSAPAPSVKACRRWIRMQSSPSALICGQVMRRGYPSGQRPQTALGEQTRHGIDDCAVGKNVRRQRPVRDAQVIAQQAFHDRTQIGRRLEIARLVQVGLAQAGPVG